MAGSGQLTQTGSPVTGFVVPLRRPGHRSVGGTASAGAAADIEIATARNVT